MDDDFISGHCMEKSARLEWNTTNVSTQHDFCPQLIKPSFRAAAGFWGWKEGRSRISVFRDQASKETTWKKLYRKQIKLNHLPSWQNWWNTFAKKRYHLGSYAFRPYDIMVLTASKISSFCANKCQIWRQVLAVLPAEELGFVQCYAEQPLYLSA